jgi:carboxyl-terminal processing protease
MNKSGRFLPIIFALVLVLGMIIGSLINSSRNNELILTYGNGGTSKVDNIIDYVVTNYVDTVKRKELEKYAITGLLEDLDPHSSYITAEEFHEINDPLLGSFEGIGISFRIEKDTIMVINTIPGGPSEKVGLMGGDRIVKVNDSLIAGNSITNNKAVRLLKGKKGTKVKVSVYRRGVPNLLDFTITRDVIPVYSMDVAYMVNDSIGYIKLNKFSATTADEFKKGVQKLRKQGMTALILDLRGNPGGFLKAAIDISDDFLSDGKLIVYTEGKARPRKYAFATSKGIWEDNTVVVLIDEGSASASEIVSGAVQDNDRGLIIGRRSFGKGLVQEQLPFADGSALRLTVARYYTPTGRSIQKPYKKNDFKDYYEEAYERYLNGELQHPDSIHFPDSLKFTTPDGKTVYGGGGIMPDIYVPLVTDTIHTFYNILSNKGLIFRFAFDYTDKNRNKLSKFKDFDSFNESFYMTDVEYDSLVKFAEAKGIKSTPEKINVSKSRIKILFKAFVGRNILDEKGFYPIYHQIDTTFKRAVYEIETNDKNIR